MGSLFSRPSTTAARAAERAAELQRIQTQQQYEETTRRSQEAELESKAKAAEQMQRQLAAETLQKNLQKIAQEQGAEVAEVVAGGSAEQTQPNQKRKRKMPALSTTLGIDIV